MTTATPIRVHTALETLPIDTLVPYARNSRTHSPEQVAQIAASIREFGFTNPVLIDDAGGIIAGHGRVLGARAVGLAAVPCLRLVGLSDAQKRAYVIADNKLALNAGWDESLLALELEDLLQMDFDLQLLGFDPETLDDLLPGTEGETPQKEETHMGINYQEKYAVLVDCKDEPDQKRIFDKLTAGGMTCKVLVN